jgi:hypothetical protein
LKWKARRNKRDNRQNLGPKAATNSQRMGDKWERRQQLGDKGNRLSRSSHKQGDMKKELWRQVERTNERQGKPFFK